MWMVMNLIKREESILRTRKKDSTDGKAKVQAESKWGSIFGAIFSTQKVSCIVVVKSRRIYGTDCPDMVSE